jgi:hypothetical protein
MNCPGNDPVNHPKPQNPKTPKPLTLTFSYIY